MLPYFLNSCDVSNWWKTSCLSTKLATEKYIESTLKLNDERIIELKSYIINLLLSQSILLAVMFLLPTVLCPSFDQWARFENNINNILSTDRKEIKPVYIVSANTSFLKNRFDLEVNEVNVILPNTYCLNCIKILPRRSLLMPHLSAQWNCFRKLLQ